MRILAINTATENCSVALWNTGTVYTFSEKCYCDHTKYILPLVETVLNKSKVNLTDLDALAFGQGPGSFTGVRIGVGIAKGLALGAGLPMIGISTLATMAQGAWRIVGATRVLTAIDAKMGEVYWAEYVRNENGIWHGKDSEAIIKIGSINTRLKQLSGEWIKVGTGWKQYLTITDEYNIFLQKDNMLLPTAEDMLPIAYQLFTIGQTVSAEEAEPVYLRNRVTNRKF